MFCKKSVEISYQQLSKNFQGILLRWILENSDYLKTENKYLKLIFV